jgi:hypothetical protein
MSKIFDMMSGIYYLCLQENAIEVPMSLREKFAWVAVLTLIVGTSAYFLTALLGHQYVGYRQLLWICLGLIVGTITFPLVMRLVLKRQAPTGSLKEQDERERLFEFKATRVAFFVMAIGLLLSTPFLVHAPGTREDVVHFILATIVVSYVVKFGLEILYHRRGY